MSKALVLNNKMPIGIVLCSKCYKQDEIMLYRFGPQSSRVTIRSRMNILNVDFMVTSYVPLIYFEMPQSFKNL